MKRTERGAGNTNREQKKKAGDERERVKRESFFSSFLSLTSFTYSLSPSRVQIVGRLEQLERELRRELEVRDGLGTAIVF